MDGASRSCPFHSHTGDVLDHLPTVPRATFDDVLCDPPYGLEFMGKQWDHGVPGEPYWQAIRRVCKPGAMLLAFGGTRTHHRLMCAIEDAGWEIRDCLMWVYGSGLPKGPNISKLIDKAAGAKRRSSGETYKHPDGKNRACVIDAGNSSLYKYGECGKPFEYDIVFVQGNLFAVADAWAGAFNTVCAFQVLEHMVNPDVGMAAFRRLARHRLVLTVPAGMPSADQTAGDGHVHGWTDQEAFERYLERWGTVVPVASDDNHLGAMVQWA